MVTKKPRQVKSLLPTPKTPPLVASGLLSLAIASGCRTQNAAETRAVEPTTIPPQPVPDRDTVLVQQLNRLGDMSPFRSIESLAGTILLSTNRLANILNQQGIRTRLNLPARRLTRGLQQPVDRAQTSASGPSTFPGPIPPQPAPPRLEVIIEQINALANASPFRTLETLSQALGQSSDALALRIGSPNLPIPRRLSAHTLRLIDGLVPPVIAPQPPPRDDFNR